MGKAVIRNVRWWGRLRWDNTIPWKDIGWERTWKLVKLLRRQKVKFSQEYDPVEDVFIVKWGKDVEKEADNGNRATDTKEER